MTETTKMTKELHLKLVAAWWDGELETTLGAGLWEKAPFPPNDEADPSFFRIRPKSTLRPWKPEEVPLGGFIRLPLNPGSGNYSAPGMIVGLTIGHNVQYVGGSHTWAEISLHDLFRKGEHSVDGGKTWKPCGVPSEESQ